MTTDQIIGLVLEREGGYVNDPADKGGPTNMGFTIATLAGWRGVPVASLTAADVQALGEPEARAIYQARYVTGPGFADLHDPVLRAFVVDAGVLSGPRNATRMLQRALRGVPVDGVCGAVTLAAANSRGIRELRAKFVAERVRFLGRLVTNDLTDEDRDGIPDNTEHAAGWFNRVADDVEALS